MTKVRKEKRAKRETYMPWLNKHECPNCKKILHGDEGHFVAPCFGDEGHFICEDSSLNKDIQEEI